MLNLRRHDKVDLGDLERFVLFVGYPRSGHTLIATILDAHPDIALANEVDALGLVRDGADRPQLVAAILERTRSFERSGTAWMGFDYAVPGQWQGRVRRLRVIGDKKAGTSSLHLADDLELLARLRAVVALPVTVLHVVRDPWRVVAAMSRRSGQSLEESGTRFLSMLRSVASLRDAGVDLVDLWYEDLLDAPDAVCRQLAALLGVEPVADWVGASAGRVVRQPVHEPPAWPSAVHDSLLEASAANPWLRRYVDRHTSERS